MGSGMIYRNIKYHRRKEKGNCCEWPIWFADGRDDKFFYGDIVDFSTDSLAIICENNADVLQSGYQVKIHFGYSHVDLEKTSGIEIFSCVGDIYQLEKSGKKFSGQTCRIAIKLTKRLPFAPCEIRALNVIFEVLQKSVDKEELNIYSAGLDAGTD